MSAEVTWQHMIDQCTGMGLLAKQLYVVFTSPTNGLGPVMENLEEHLKFQMDLEKRGIMLGAGPFPDDEGKTWQGEGMVIIRAASIDEAKRIADGDPMHRSGARSYRIRPWLLNEGKVTVELTFSDKGANVI